MEPSFDAIVIGGGVVGLACAAALSRRKKVLLLERHERNAMENSTRSSGVVHAGLHHPSDWLRTTLCLRGRELLARRARLEDIPYQVLGKWIVGGADDAPRLEALAERARDRGIEARLVEGSELARLDPAVRGERALFVAPTAIVRTTSLVRSLEDECDARRVTSLRGAEVVGIDLGPSEIAVHIEGARFTAPRVVVAAGLGADHLAARAGLDPDALGIRQRYVRGTWMALDPRHRKEIASLVYPLPETDGLGVHLTRDVEGFLFAGPDAEWIEAPDFDLPAPERAGEKARAFAEAIAHVLRTPVSADALHPLAVGVRPRLSARGEPARDFAIVDAARHGIAGLVVLAGIESPGLTACLAIAEEVEARLARTT